MKLTKDMLQEIIRSLGEQVRGEVPAGMGFALLLFDFGDTGTMLYASNAQREDMAKALEEMLAILRAKENQRG